MAASSATAGSVVFRGCADYQPVFGRNHYRRTVTVFLERGVRTQDPEVLFQLLGHGYGPHGAPLVVLAWRHVPGKEFGLNGRLPVFRKGRHDGYWLDLPSLSCVGRLLRVTEPDPLIREGGLR
ncbi:hypothetical protein MTO96_043872 [Rhipicephalus appendiculatus]